MFIKRIIWQSLDSAGNVDDVHRVLSYSVRGSRFLGNPLHGSSRFWICGLLDSADWTVLTLTRLFCVDVCRRDSSESPKSARYSFQDKDLLTARSLGSMGFGHEAEYMDAGFLTSRTMDSAVSNGIGSNTITVDILDSSCVAATLPQKPARSRSLRSFRCCFGGDS